MKIFNQFEIYGLSKDEVNKNISLGYVNSNNPGNSKSFKIIFFENIFSFFNIINLSVIIFILLFYFTTQDKRLLFDTFGIFLVSFFNTSLAVYQENKAIKRLEKIDILKNKSVNVIRDGVLKNIYINEIVLNDSILINQGELIPTDGVILFSSNLELDESMLSGESEPVIKVEGDKVLSGSICLYGFLVYKVLEVGKNNFSSKVIESAKKHKYNSSPLLKRINKIFLVFVLLTFIMIFVELIINFNSNIPLENSVRKISAFATFLLPEGLIFFSIVNFYFGILRISKSGAIIQKLNAIDSFAEIDSICLDKTGTLTKNKISVKEIIYLNDEFTTEQIENMLGAFYQCSSYKNSTLNALQNYKSFNKYSLISELPFKSELKYSNVKISVKNEIFDMYLGAVEFFKLSINNFDKYKNYRNVLFCLKNSFNHFIPICLLIMYDEPRYDSKSTFELFNKNQIDIKILSGDSKESIKSTLKNLNIQIPDEDVYSRLKPYEKLDIIKKIKKNKKCVRFIGDGLNDLPAIKESDLGISMESGAEATKIASDIILLKNNFNLLPEIFDEGKRIINSIFVITNLVIVKNIVLILLSIFVWLGVLEFQFSPRTVSFWSLFAISFPAYFISFRFSDSSKINNFYSKIFKISIINSICLSILLFFSINFLNSYRPDISPFLIIIPLFIGFFTVQLILKDSKNKLKYIIYGFLVLSIFFFSNLLSDKFFVFKIIFNFYEINSFSISDFLFLFIYTLISSIILFVLNFFLYQNQFK